MTPERIAELRKIVQTHVIVGYPIARYIRSGQTLDDEFDQLLDEIERLRGLVREGHKRWISVDALGTTTGFPPSEKHRCDRYVETGVRNGVKYRYGALCLNPDCSGSPRWRATWDEAHADAHVHVQAVLDRTP